MEKAGSHMSKDFAKCLTEHAIVGTIHRGPLESLKGHH